MTLMDRIGHFIEAAQGQDDPETGEDIVNRMTPYQLLSEISEALEHAGVTFNKDW